MSYLSRWDPFREMMTIRHAMDRWFENSYDPQSGDWSNVTWGLPIDVAENENGFEVKASVPGLQPEDIDISFNGNTLTIKGELKADKEYEENRYHIRERRFGTFARSLTLPTKVDGDKIAASYDAGVLTLQLPKAEEVKPRRIAIHASEQSKMIEGKVRGKNGK